MPMARRLGDQANPPPVTGLRKQKSEEQKANERAPHTSLRAYALTSSTMNPFLESRLGENWHELPPQQQGSKEKQAQALAPTDVTAEFASHETC